MDKSTRILKRLELLHPKKIDLSLDRIKNLLTKLGNPQSKLPPTIHIAGTNGKGSVTSFLRSIYENAGLNVHTYTSPHLINFNERIRINSELISNNELASLLEECEYYNKGKQITFFEITTAAAFLAFSRLSSDIVLMETGLGGKFDATNVIENKICSVLTPISMDHMNFLGSTLSKITLEKLGILKNTKTVIIGKQAAIVRKLARLESKKNNIKLYEEGLDWKVSGKNLKKKEFYFSYDKKTFKFKFPSLHGEHQVDNASIAIATTLYLKKFGFNKNIINKGLLSASWPGRMQKLDKGKLSKILGEKFEIWLDGGHNLDASEVIKKKIKEWKGEKVFLVIGMMIGKDVIGFIKNLIKDISGLFLLPIADHQYIQPYEIKENIELKLNTNIQIECILEIKEALKNIEKKAPSGRVIICGSLYLAGEILKEDGFKII